MKKVLLMLSEFPNIPDISVLGEGSFEKHASARRKR